jgi:DNA-binding XRE family transcriptional regulator
MESRRVREVCVRSQEEVAQIMGTSQATVAKIERAALRKLRDLPEAKILLRYVCQQNSRPVSPTVEPTILRELGTPPGDASFMTISGFAPNL